MVAFAVRAVRAATGRLVAYLALVLSAPAAALWVLIVFAEMFDAVA